MTGDDPETWIHPLNGSVDDVGGSGYPVGDVLGFSGLKWDVCPSEIVTWNGGEAVEVVAMGPWMVALQLESLVVDEDSLTSLWSLP